MDKVYTMMLDRYFCATNSEGKSPAFWMTEEKLKKPVRTLTQEKTQCWVLFRQTLV